MERGALLEQADIFNDSALIDSQILFSVANPKNLVILSSLPRVLSAIALQPSSDHEPYQHPQEAIAINLCRAGINPNLMEDD